MAIELCKPKPDIWHCAACLRHISEDGIAFGPWSRYKRRLCAECVREMSALLATSSLIRVRKATGPNGERMVIYGEIRLSEGWRFDQGESYHPGAVALIHST